MIFLLTGSSGFIGNAILNYLIKNEHTVYCFRRSNICKEEVIRKNIFYITDNDLKTFDVKLDVFIHAAWGGTRGNSRDTEDIQKQNILDLHNLLRFASKLKLKTIISFGSQAEYGNVEKTKTDMKFEPVSYYGAYKLKAKEIISEFCSENSIRFVWLRLFSVYGQGDYANSLISILIKQMKRNETIDLTECVQYWDYLNISDFLDVFNIFINNNNLSGEFNIAYGESRKLKEYIEIIKNILNSKSKLNYGAIKYPETGYTNLIVDISDLTEKTGWKPKISFEKGIDKILEINQ